ncbi:MAG: hypothetical protein ACPGF7_03580 [Pontibacterium sp.]
MKKVITMVAALALTPAFASAESFQEVFEMNRAMYGPGHTFEWNGGKFSTNHEEEVEASVKATQANALDLIAKAVAKNKEVAALGFEWKLTGGILMDAQKAADAGDYQKAMNLAAQAKYHARIGIQQHAYAQNHWHLSVPQ